MDFWWSSVWIGLFLLRFASPLEMMAMHERERAISVNTYNAALEPSAPISRIVSVTAMFQQLQAITLVAVATEVNPFQNARTIAAV